MNVIVFMTDGRPNGVTANFTPLRNVFGGCNVSDNLTGVLAQWANGAVPTGTTAGLMNIISTSLSSPNDGAISGGTGCQFENDLTDVKSDITGMPATDIYGDALAGPYSQENPAWPYNGLPARPSTPRK